jgi:hypothetical protein
MKIRIKGNTIRLRLTQSEVAALSEQGIVEERVNFAQSTFKYILQGAKDESFSADFIDNTLTVYMPLEIWTQWYKNSEVGYSHTLTYSNGSTLALLIEKDFTCLDNTSEDQSDNYPNPKAVC